MKKVGIVVEYNPFHNGHLYQIEKTREIFGGDTFVAVVMSGNYVQRGESSLLDKWEKTELALEYGVDLVLELPVYYAIQNAEVFCKMATKILDYLEMDIQVFGGETEDIREFYEIIRLQKTKEFQGKLKDKLRIGNNYVKAQEEVLRECGYNDFFKSNNILGLEYVRSIIENNMEIEPYVIKREVSEYNESEIPEDRKKFASASYIRECFLKNSEEIKEFLPEKSFDMLKNKEKQNIQKQIFNILKYKILIEKKENIIKIYDITEDIYNRLYNIIKKSKDYAELIRNFKSRNFSTKRMERILLNILFDIEKIDFNIDYIRVLGFNKRGQEYLKYLKNKKNKENIFVNWKNIEKTEKSIHNDKIKIEKNVFIIDELLFDKKERLNPIIKN